MSKIATMSFRDAVQKAFIARPHEERPVESSDSDDTSSIGFDEIAPVVDISKKSSITQPVSRSSVELQQAKKPAYTPAQFVDLLTTAATFLPLQDLNNLRQLGGVFTTAVERVAPQPLGTPDATFIRWEPTVLRPTGPRPGAHSFHWRCLACGMIGCGPRTCSHCKAPVVQSACRVFLGQMRKDFTAELTAYMLRSICPTITVLHIESHTNASDGRGKGCAWVYVNSVEDALQITQLHKRVFVDVDAFGNEGFWYVSTKDAVPRLGAMADALGGLRSRPSVLPRQPMVAELPGNSMLSDYARNLMMH